MNQQQYDEGTGEVRYQVMTEPQIEALIKTICRMTAKRPELWMEIDKDADPYLGADGAKLVATGFHISITSVKFDEPERTGEKDDNGEEIVGYGVRITGRRTMEDGTVREWTDYGHAMTDLKQIVAQRSRVYARDYGKDIKKGDPKEPSLTRGEAMSRARDMAKARALNRVITGILGIPAITWDDLEVNGISRDAVKSRDGKSKDADFLWTVLKGNARGLTKDDLGAVSSRICGGFAKITDMSASQIRDVARELRAMQQGNGQPRAQQRQAQQQREPEPQRQQPAQRPADNGNGAARASDEQQAALRDGAKELAALGQQGGMVAALEAVGWQRGSQSVSAQQAEQAIAWMKARIADLSAGVPNDDDIPL